MNLQENLLEWVSQNQINSNHLPYKCTYLEQLSDGVQFYYICQQMQCLIRSPIYFNTNDIQINTEDNWIYKHRNLIRLIKNLEFYYNEVLIVNFAQFASGINLIEIAQNSNIQGIVQLSKLVISAALLCDNKQNYIEQMRLMDAKVQQTIIELVQDVINQSEGERSEINTLRGDRRILISEIDKLQKELEIYSEEFQNQKEEIFRLRQRLANSNSVPPSPKDEKQDKSLFLTNVDLKNQLREKDEEIKQMKLRAIGQKQEMQDQLDLFQDQIISNQNKLTKYRKLKQIIRNYREKSIAWENMSQENRALKLQLEMLMIQIKEKNEVNVDELRENLQYYKLLLEQKKQETENLLGLVQEKDEEVQNLNIKFKQLSQKNQILTENNQQLQRQVSKLTDELDFAKNQESIFDMSGCLNESVRLDADLSSIMYHNPAIEEVSQQLQQQTMKNQKLQQQINKKKQSLNEYKKHCVELQSKISWLEGQISTDNKDDSYLIKYITEENQKLLADKDKQYEEFKRILIEKDELMQKVIELKDKVYDLEKAVNDKELELNAVRNENQYLSNQNQDCSISQISFSVDSSEKVLRLQKNIQNKKQEIAQLKLTIFEKDKIITELQTQIQTLNSQIKNNKQIHQSEILGLQSEIDCFKSQIQQLQKDRNDAQEDFQKEQKLMACVINQIGWDIFNSNRYRKPVLTQLSSEDQNDIKAS